MITTAVGFLLGILSLNLFHTLPSLSTIICGMALLSFLSFITKRFCKLPLVLAFIFGFFWMWLHAKSVIDQWIPPTIEGKTIEVIGVIDSISNLEKELSSFDFDIQTVVSPVTWLNPGRIRIRWALPPNLQAGDQWQFSIRLKRPRAYSNPGSFDLEKKFFQKNIVGEGTVVESLPYKKLRSATWNHLIDQFRFWLKNKLNLSLKDHAFSGIIYALVIGMQENIPLQQWEVFRKTGTAHLVAVSGLHIGLIASSVFFLMRILSRFLPIYFFKIPIPIFCAIISLITTITYALLAGFGVATRRALIMIAFFMCFLLKRRLYSVVQGYFGALMLVLLFDPLSTLSTGFWLSFGAVAFILYGMKGRLKPTGVWYKWGRVQWIVGCGLIPVTLNSFNMASLISPVANLIAIPWVSFLVVPLSLLGSILGSLDLNIGTFFLKMATNCFAALWPILEKLSHIPKITFECAMLSNTTLIMLTIGILLLLTPRGFPVKYVGLIWILPVFFTKPEIIEKNTAKVTVLDVGQGLATVVETKNHVLVFDTGPRLSKHFDTGERVVLPYLATRGIKNIDALILSHNDNDHVGGAKSILQKINVKKIISSEKLFESKNLELCFAGQQWEWDGVLFEMLHPTPTAVLTSKRNERSCVLRIKTAKHSVLLTADIEANSEKLLIRKAPKQLSATVMLVPHHGSRTSSTLEFIRTVSPKYAIIPVGYLNAYGHPKPEIVERYKREGVMIFDTVKDGAVSFTLNDKETLIMLEPYRLKNQKYWHIPFALKY